MLKFLVNFFFYKFGIEITFIAIVLLMGKRMDMLALIYMACLFALFLGSPRIQRTVWPYFKLAVFVLTLLQYLMLLGVPPFLCPAGTIRTPRQHCAFLRVCI